MILIYNNKISNNQTKFNESFKNVYIFWIIKINWDKYIRSSNVNLFLIFTFFK